MFTLDEFLGSEMHDPMSKSVSLFDDLELDTQRTESTPEYLEIECARQKKQEKKMPSILTATLPGQKYTVNPNPKRLDAVHDARTIFGGKSIQTDTWCGKRRRRIHPVFWSYLQKERESPYNAEAFLPYLKNPPEKKAHKMCLGIIKKPALPQEKSTVNTILPLYLNSTTSFEGTTQRMEFLKISKNFIDRVRDMDYNALTVQQLKSIMKEFGLNYTGKKKELIKRIQSTYQKILVKQQKEGIGDPTEEKKEEGEPQEDKSTLGFMFF